MTAAVTGIFRYPIKSVGSESVDAVTFVEGQTMPWDRTWAIAHEHAQTDGTEWARCLNFLRVASSPALAAVRAALDTESEKLTLTHPQRPELTIAPDQEADALLSWLQPIVKEGRALPKRVVRVPGRGMTDTRIPSISIANLASHRAVSQRVGHDLSLLRWRSNIWLDGLAPWEELEWPGKTILIGEALFEIVEPIARCLNVQASPETGRRDLNVLGALESWDHQDFSMAALVKQGGRVAVGDSVAIQ